MKKEVFISYHTNSSRHVVEKICNCLEENGVSCWYAPRDVISTYASSIVHAIDGCRVFLLILNEKSNESEDVLNEINCAFERFRRKEDIVLLPFRTSECSLSSDMTYYIGRVHIMNGALPPEEIRIQELVDRILGLLGKTRQRQLTINIGAGNSAPETYRIVNSRPSLDPLFVGRQEEIRQVRETLSGAHNKVALVGMGGIGKSEIAKNIVWNCADLYDMVVWLSFCGSIRQTVIDDYGFSIAGLSREDYPNDSDEAYFRRKMRIFRRIADRHVLVMLDNFDVEFDPDLEELCSGEYGVLVTSRCDQEQNRLAQITVSKLEKPEELTALFEGEYRRPLSGRDRDVVREIIRFFDGHTLAIRMVAACMRSQRILPEKMLSLLKEKGSAMSRELRAVEGFFGKLEQIYHAAELNETELLILKNLSLLPIAGAYVVRFCDWCGLEQFDEIDDLIRRNWIVHDQVQDAIHLHPMVSELMHRKLLCDLACCETMVHSIYEDCIQTYDHGYKDKMQMLGCVSYLGSRLPAGTRVWAEAQIGYGILLNELGRYEESVKTYRDILAREIPEQMRVIVHARMALSLGLGGKTEESLECTKTGIALYSGLPSELRAQKDVMLPANWLIQQMCETSRWKRDFAAAVRYGKEAVSVIGNGLNARDRDVCWSKYHYGLALLLNGDYAESERQLTEAAQIFNGYEGAFFRMCCLEILSQVKLAQGDPQGALRLLSGSEELLAERYEEPHMDVARNHIFHGNVYRAMQDLDKAREYYARAADVAKVCRPQWETVIRGLAEDSRLLVDVYGMIFLQ